MGDLISRCGMNCGICPAYRENIKSDEDRIAIDKGWKKFHGTPGWNYDRLYCEGCLPDEKAAILFTNCWLRRCTFLNEVENCGYCLDYPCPRINNMISIMRGIERRTIETGTPDNYEKFVKPHLIKDRLDIVFF